ncbi:MAG: hypothetical protein HQM13_16170 [SAR324 cluster bacterium]|nr:hypothetical protein [SAR324 cluster bacterium]
MADTPFFTSPDAEDGLKKEENEVQILSSEGLEDVIQELTALRGETEEEFDSDSVDNAVRLCEKIDICFETLDTQQKLLLIQNFEFFSSSSQLTLFVKLMFRGGITSKEITFRALSRKLKATSDVIECVLSTKSFFESPETAEEAQHGLKTFIDSLASSYANLIPPSIRNTTKNHLSVSWLQKVLSQHDPIFNQSEVSYSEVTRQFTDLLYAIFSNDQLTIYLKWKDQYLRYWLSQKLREEDRKNTSSVPALSTAKAELYVGYLKWTKISKRLNANLRHRQTFDTETTIRAEKVLLDRLPSNILLELVSKLRKQMTEEESVPEVDLGMDEGALDEMALYEEMVDDIFEAEEKRGSISWLSNIVKKLKEVMHPKVQEPELSIQFVERIFPQKLLPVVKADRMRFGENFPQDYPADIPEKYSKFFTKSHNNFYVAFEETVLEILMIYEENDFSCISNTPHELLWTDNQHPFEFEEHALALLVEEQYLLLLGNSYFVMSFKDYNRHPNPHGYFKCFRKVKEPQAGKAFCMVNEQAFQEIPLNQINSNNEASEGLIRVIDSLPDESREKKVVQQLLNFFI